MVKEEKDTLLFQSLVAMLHGGAMHAMGKIINPATGKTERELEQARVFIDMLEMLRTRTSGQLSSDEKKFLDTVITESQLNFIDEQKKNTAVNEPPTNDEKPVDAIPAPESSTAGKTE